MLVWFPPATCRWWGSCGDGSACGLSNPLFGLEEAAAGIFTSGFTVELSNNTNPLFGYALPHAQPTKEDPSRRARESNPGYTIGLLWGFRFPG